jgi:hypothetical protein
MIGQLLGLVALLAAIVVGARRLQRTRAERRRPGATIYLPVTVQRFDEIDAAVQGQKCWCGGMLVDAGETSRVVGERRFRIVRLVCQDCERDEFVYFDVTAVFH